MNSGTGETGTPADAAAKDGMPGTGHFASSDEYVRFSAPHLTGVILKTGSAAVSDPVSLLSVPDDPRYCCKKGRTVQAGVTGTHFVKRICHKTLFASLRHLFTTPRPLRCLAAARQLEQAQVATPRVAAALRQYRYFLPQYDYLITEDISQEVTFADKLPQSKELIPALAGLLCRMHAGGIEHGDVNLRNLYQEHTGAWGVIDLDGCRLSRTSVSEKRRIRELARLASSYLKQYGPAAEEDIPGCFARAYRELSGIDLDTAAYRERIRYLVDRKRK